ncbi:MAG: beta-galactosidase [Spirochaetaceae bacterium]
MLFGAAYYPEHRDQGKWTYDVDMMERAGVNCLRIGEFAWKLFEPSEGKYDFSWLDSFLDIAQKKNIDVLLCPPLRTAPNWLVKKNPEVLIKLESGESLTFGSRYTFCINNPVLLERAGFLADKMSSYYSNHPSITGWHLDNEFGDEPDCHCKYCQKGFIDFCTNRYENINILNHEWGLDFWGLRLDSFDEIISPQITKTFHSPGHLQSWRQFRSDSTNKAVALLSGEVRKNKGKKQFVTTNHQPLWNANTDYFDMTKYLDINGTNYYPPYGGSKGLNISMGLCAARGYGKRKFQVHELRNGPHMIPGAENNTPAPGEIEKTTMHVIANGAVGIFYFRWKSCVFGAEQSHGTIVDYNGKPRRIYDEVSRVGSKLSELKDLIDNSIINSAVAMLYDFPTRWIMETGSSWNGPKNLYIERTKKIYSVIQRFGINMDLTGRNQDWNDYNILIIPFLSAMTDSLAKKILDFVSTGGIVIMHPLCGNKDINGQIYPDRIHPILKDVLGFDISDFITLGQTEKEKFNWNNKTYCFSIFSDLVKDIDDKTKVSAKISSNWYNNFPALCEKTLGKGSLTYLSVFPDEEFYSDYFFNLFTTNGLFEDIIIEYDKMLPIGIELITHTLDEKQEVYYLINHNTDTITLECKYSMKDLYHNKLIKAGHFEIEPYGIRVLLINNN